MLRQGDNGAAATHNTAGYSRFTPKIGKPELNLVSGNRKTEICRNWQRGRCIYGASKCAFAHGKHELKHQTLNEMEHTGRIPNASKFRCYPCLTWVTTGSCPYFARCVFIHDPRIRGPTDAYLYKSNVSNKSHAGKGGGGGGEGGGVGSPFGRDIFYWPDMARTDADGNVLPTISVNYDMDPRMLESHYPTERAVYQLWYSLVGTILGISGESKIAASEPDPRDSFFTAPPAESKDATAGEADAHRRLATSASCPQEPWRTKDPARRLPLFLRMSKGAPVSPAYVPVPTTTAGPHNIWKDPCKHCELADRLEGVPPMAPRPLSRPTSRNVQQSPFPLAEIGTDPVSSVEARSPAKPIRRKEQAWRLDATMGEENQRPRGGASSGREDSSSGSSLPPRRSTAPPALGRAATDRSRAAGSQVARGLFDNAHQGLASTNNVVQHENKVRRRFGTTMSEGGNKDDGSWEDMVRSALPEEKGRGAAASSTPRSSRTSSAAMMMTNPPTPLSIPWSHSAMSYDKAPTTSPPPSTAAAATAMMTPRPASSFSFLASEISNDGHDLSPAASATTPAATPGAPVVVTSGSAGTTTDTWSPSSAAAAAAAAAAGSSRYSPLDHAASSTCSGASAGAEHQAFHTDISNYTRNDGRGSSDGGGGGGGGGGGSGSGGGKAGRTANQSTTYPFGSFAEGM